jgi:chromosome segregation protein
MQLRKLELFGFKSFADRTKFQFGPGVTIIVGPNGCGKSNVVDAMKWILGEQSAKSLRGSEMLDVIFNGSKTRKSLGFAEASLTFTNTRGIIHPDLDEICISRRLHRDGQSEYKINKKSCRLKDIRELFMDTGVGLKAYSIIEQGKIDAFLQASPQDRRLVFEEAAGISKYKARKKEALRRLDRVRHNLEMISNTVSELERRLRSLKIQAGRARSWREASERRRKLLVALALHRYHHSIQECLRVSGELALATASMEDLRAGMAASEAEVAQSEESLREYDGRISEKSNELVHVENRFNAANEKIRDNKITIENLRTEEIRIQERREETQRRIAEQNAELEALGARRSEAVASEQRISGQIRVHEDEISEVLRKLEDASEGIQKGKGEIFSVQSAQTRINNDIEAVDTRLAELGRRRVSLETEREGVINQRDGASAKCGVHHLEIEAAKERHEVLLLEHKELETRKEELEKDLAARKKTVAELGEAHLRVSSRIEVFEGYRDRLEGVSEGARQVIEESRKETPAVAGVQGLLVDRLRVEEKYARAVEEALGGENADVLVESFEAARGAVDFLKESKKGRGTFVPSDDCSELPDEEDSPATYPGVLGRALDFVECDEAVAPLMRRRLGWTLVVENLDVARGLRDLFRGYDFVTLEGEVLRSDGSLTGGSATMGRISHAAEIERLGNRQEDLAARLAGERSELERQTAAFNEVSARFREVTYQVYDTGMQLAKAEEALAESQKALEEFKSQIEVIEGDLGALDDQREINGREREELAVKARELSERKDEAIALLNRLDGEIEALEKEREEIGETLNTLSTDKVVTETEIRGIDESIDRVRRDLEERGARLEEFRTELGEKATRREHLRKESERLAERATQLQKEVGGIKQEIEFLHGIRDEIEQEKSLAAAALSEKKAEEAEVSQKVQDLKLEEGRLGLVKENIVARSREELDVDIEDLYSEFEDEREDWEAIEDEEKALKEKLRNLGTPNLDAIEEFEIEQERHTYLTGQRDDLLAAQTQIASIIRQIDRKSRKMFAETFETVRQNFKVIFKKLFNGGKADILLADPGDLLESPIDIMAQPKDKKPAYISLLSGGEKVMTCIALLFAVFKSRPSPFCILDEVDAALDERNIDRFVNMLSDFLEGSQFIIISHNKRTIMVGDQIFGITMQEAGVSKKVSLQIRQAQEMADEIARVEEEKKKAGQPEPKEAVAATSA